MPSVAVFHTSPASVSWTSEPPGAARVVVEGEVDATNRHELLATLEAALHAPGAREVCIDVTRLTFCDARGLLGAASLTRAARSAGTSVDVVGLAPHLARLLRIVGAELA